MPRTYLPTLVDAARVLAVYITRYRQTIDLFLDEEQKGALNQLLVALNLFIHLVEITENP